jgi:hypothetical protein
MTNNDPQNTTLVHAVYYIFYKSSNVSFLISIAKVKVRIQMSSIAGYTLSIRFNLRIYMSITYYFVS